MRPPALAPQLKRDPLGSDEEAAMTRSARHKIAVVALTYCGLWGLTAAFGVPSVRRAGVAIVTHDCSLCAHGPEHQDLAECAPSQLNCVTAWTPGPFLVRMEYRYHIIEGMRSGRETDAWLFGVRVRLVSQEPSTWPFSSRSGAAA